MKGRLQVVDLKRVQTRFTCQDIVKHQMAGTKQTFFPSHKMQLMISRIRHQVVQPFAIHHV